MYIRIIIQGKLFFKKEKSFDKSLRMFKHREENYYKEELPFTDEDIFNRDELAIIIPRMAIQVTEKMWKNTKDALEYLAQFAVAGYVGLWHTESGEIQEHLGVVPESDKGIINLYGEAREHLHEEEDLKKSLKVLDRVLDRFERHPQALERRGHIYFKLGENEKALRDFDRAAKLDPQYPYSHYGKAKVHARRGDVDQTIDALQAVTRNAIALQPVYWIARRLRGKYFIDKEQWTKAEFELKLFSNRSFAEDDPNASWKGWSLFQYGIVLMKLEQFERAQQAFDKSLEVQQGSGDISRAERLMYRGLARQMAGSSGFISDWKEAADLGHNEAESLLEEHA